jgi:hypothetical protein
MKKFIKEVFMKKNIIFSALAAFVLGGVFGAYVVKEIFDTSPGTQGQNMYDAQPDKNVNLSPATGANR